MKNIKKICRAVIIAAVTLNLSSFNISAFDNSPTKFIDSPYDFGLSDFYKPIAGTTMDKVYDELRSEYPDEIPVVMPREVKGETKIFVSPDGDDNRGDGSEAYPYQTIQKALRVVRNMSFDKKAKGCVIYLRGGVYSFDESLSLSNADYGTKNAPLFISAYNGEEVTVTGATVLETSDFEPVSDSSVKELLRPAAREKVLVTDLKKKGIDSFGGINLTTGDYAQVPEANVYWNNSLMTLARYPNNSSLSIGTVIDTGPIKTVDGAGNDPSFVDDGRGFEFELVDSRPLSWKNTDDIYMSGMMFWQWRPGVYKVRELNAERNSVRSVNYSQYGVREAEETSYYFFNVFEELDCPGEWYVDRDKGLLYIYPFEDGADSAKISFSTSSFDLVSLNGAKHIYFDGINFKYNSKSAVSMQNCEEVVFQNCDISLMGEFGLYIKGCSYSGATTCNLYNCNDSMVRVLPRDDFYNSKKGIPTRNFIQNCFISRQGIEDHSAGIYGADTGMIISHNLFQKFAAAAITPEGSEVIVEYNEIMGSPYEVEDMGAFYAGQLTDNTYTQVRFNYFHDTAASENAAQTVYLDGFGSLYAVYGNVMKNIPAGLKSHTGIKNMWVNNVVTGTIVPNGNLIDIAMSYYTQGNAFWPSYIREKWNGLFNKHWRGAENYLDGFHSKRYPHLYEYLNGLYEYFNRSSKEGYTRDELEEALRTPSGYYFKNNVSYKHSDFAFHEVMYPTMIGYDENYVAGEKDPGFVDWENGDLSFKEDAEIYKILPEFEEPPFEKMGLITNGTRWENFGITKAPELITPSADSVGEEVYSNVSFSWEKIMCAGRYRLTVALDPDFENVCYDKELDLTGVDLELPEMGAEYWWRVEAIPKTKSLDSTSMTSKIGHFKVKSYEEMLATERPNTKYLDREIESVLAFAEALVEGENPGEYKQGTKEALINAAEEAKLFGESPHIQPEIDEEVEAFKKKISKIRSNVNVGFEALAGFEGFKSTGRTDASAVKAGESLVSFDPSASNQQTMTGGQPLKNGVIYTWRGKLDSVNGWMVFGNYENSEATFGSDNSYCIVLSGGASIELQKYSPTKSYYIIHSVDDGGIIKPGEWQEFAYGLIPVEDGMRAVFYVDGKLVLDYTDKESPLYYDGAFLTLGNPQNENIYLAPSEMIYDKIPE